MLDLNNISPIKRETASFSHTLASSNCISDLLQYNKLLILRYMLSFLQVVFSFRGNEMYLRLISDEKPFPL